jgi:hypothetical protein
MREGKIEKLINVRWREVDLQLMHRSSMLRMSDSTRAASHIVRPDDHASSGVQKR